MKDTVKSFVVALFIAVLIRSVLFEPYSIPSGSMKPNFEEGDYIFVSKFSYGISNYSFPYFPNFFKGRKFQFSIPSRGDVVVFRLPTNPNIHYIKRLIGLPGDKIQVRSGELYLNGTKLDYKMNQAYVDKNGVKINQYIEKLPSGVEYNILDSTPYGMLDNTKEFIVPERHYFMMGDNRDSSVDSRMIDGPVGFVPEDYFVGKVDFILFSNSTPVWQIWKWPFTFNMDRFAKIVRP